jgi:hypothetical protein
MSSTEKENGEGYSFAKIGKNKGKTKRKSAFLFWSETENLQ